jgi:hypothetical protein
MPEDQRRQENVLFFPNIDELSEFLSCSDPHIKQTGLRESERRRPGLTPAARRGPLRHIGALPRDVRRDPEPEGDGGPQRARTKKATGEYAPPCSLTAAQLGRLLPCVFNTNVFSSISVRFRVKTRSGWTGFDPKRDE